MHPSRLLLGLCLSVLMTACGPRGLTPDRELYGTWVDPIHGTQMTLREDMTMDFFGREGTWRVVDNSRFLDCRSPVYCDKRLVLNGIEDNDGIEFNSSDLRAHPDKFKFNARGTLTMNGRFRRHSSDLAALPRRQLSRSLYLSPLSGCYPSQSI